MIYRVCRPQVLHRNGQFHFFLQIFALGGGGARENLQEKMKLTISLPQGPLKEPWIPIVPMVPYCPYGSLLFLWFPIVLSLIHI